MKSGILEIRAKALSAVGYLGKYRSFTLMFDYSSELYEDEKLFFVRLRTYTQDAMRLFNGLILIRADKDTYQRVGYFMFDERWRLLEDLISPWNGVERTIVKII